MNTKMNTKVLLSCANGNSLIGAPEITCLPSGNWSAPFPICESKCHNTLSPYNTTVTNLPRGTKICSTLVLRETPCMKAYLKLEADTNNSINIGTEAILILL
jgi:hypothetical protein